MNKLYKLYELCASATCESTNPDNFDDSDNLRAGGDLGEISGVNGVFIICILIVYSSQDLNYTINRVI